MKVSLTSPAATPATNSGSSGSGFGLLILGLVIAGLAYLGYQHYTKEDKDEPVKS